MLKDGDLIWVNEIRDNAYTAVPATVVFPGEHSDGSVPYVTSIPNGPNAFGITDDWRSREDARKSYTPDQLQELEQHTKNCYCETIELMRNGCGCGGR